jgi:hypothetical protein
VALLVFETLTGEEMKGLLQGKRPLRYGMNVMVEQNGSPRLGQSTHAMPDQTARRYAASAAILSMRDRWIGAYTYTNRRIIMRLLLALLASLGLIARVEAQQRTGGGPIQKVDQCITKIGPNILTLSFYQPRMSRSQFCEEIPELGPTIIVIDSMQDEMRDMTMELRVVKAGKMGRDAIENEQILEVRVPPRKFQSGTITYEHNFLEKGSYVALIRARDTGGFKEYNATFAFSVGETSTRNFVATSFLTVCSLCGFWLWYRGRFPVRP